MRETLRKRSQEGFTLIELLIVIIILAILAAIVVFAVGTTTQNAKQAACNADAKSVETAVEAYKAQVGSWPTAQSDLTTSGPNGPWLRQWPPATLTPNGYQISLGASGVVNVQTNNPAAGPSNYDTTNLCNGIVS
jgi:general secretion pathway protein G